MFITLVLILVLIAAAAYRLSSYGKEVVHTAADEVHMVTTPDLWQIRLCRYLPTGGSGEPVLLVHGFMANHLNFALPEGDSLADVLSEAGYDCWLIELRGSTSSVPPFGRSRTEPTIDDYVFRDIPAALEFIRTKTNYPKVHWVGHSFGGMLLYAYRAAFGGDTLASGTAIGSPIAFEGVRLRGVNVMLTLRHMPWSVFRGLQRLALMVGNYFNVNTRLVPVNQKNMNPLLTNRMLSSVVEAPPLPVARELAFCVAKRVWRIQNDEIDVIESMKSFDVPLFLIFGAGDSFVPLRTAEDFFESLPLKDKDLMILSQENDSVADYSHIDLLFGRESVSEVFEPIASWLQGHQIGGPERANRVKMRAKRGAPATAETEATETDEEAPAPKTKARKKAPAKKKAAATLAEAEAAKKEPAKPKAKTRRKPAAKKKPAPEDETPSTEA